MPPESPIFPPSIEALLAPLLRGRRARAGGLAPPARAWLAAHVARLLPGGALWLLPDEAAAEDAEEAARFFLGMSPGEPSGPGAPLARFPLQQPNPYEDLSPDRDASLERLGLLSRLVQRDPPRLIVTSVPALQRRCPGPRDIDGLSLMVMKDEDLDREALVAELTRAGYRRVPLVEDSGTFAIRGGIIDVFGPPLPQPIRIELLGDRIERLRLFDAASQRTLRQLDCAILGPASEIPLDPARTQEALQALDRLATEQDTPAARLLPLLRALRAGQHPIGVENLLPAFFGRLADLFDFLPQDMPVILDSAAVKASARDEYARVQQCRQRAGREGRLAFEPERIWLPPDELAARIEGRARLELGLAEAEGPEIRLGCQSLRLAREGEARPAAGDTPLGPLLDLLSRLRAAGRNVFIVTRSPARSRELRSLLGARGVPTCIEAGPFDPRWQSKELPARAIRLVEGTLAGGFELEAASLAFLPDSEIFGATRRRPRLAPVRQTLRLEPGDFVVHADFGIGRFEKLTRLRAGGAEGDFLLLGYRDGDRLYLPVTRMNLLEKYRAPEGTTPSLSRLGGTAWLRTQQKIKASLLEMATELVQTEARRRARPGRATPPPGPELSALEASFPFEETEDQTRAIQEVLSDLARPQPMDRLVCGDVGFGKTEVAVRAALLKALDGQQTAVLVPTTLLAMQHLQTFRARLADHPVRVEMLSRLVPAVRQKEILADLAAGTVDVIIGTHRLLREDVRFSDLGLLVIDEEHRFGVRHKERLKALRADVDVLTMTATPIPRTLHMSLLSLRDVSVIQTPPRGRRAIRTLLMPFTTARVREAVRQELARGGQVFFVHNWARSLPALQRFLEREIPEARVAIAHGQMPERRLEEVMTAFVRREVDVLLCTSIIESGLDIPSANTVIVHRADRFGLAQLHQIRGRVGRASERAYAYLLTPPLDLVSADARERLEALVTHSELGAGFRIANEDLELRGAGNLLGRDQSGHIAAVGFEMYCRLLERAVAEVKGQAARGAIDPDVRLPVAGFLPEGYVPDLDQRLDLYARLSRAESEQDLSSLEAEMEDRFGPPPPEAENLLELLRLKQKLRQLSAISIECAGLQVTLRMAQDNPLDTERLMRLAVSRPQEMSLNPDGTIILRLPAAARSDPLLAITAWINELAACCRAG
jgi:transcription-repair coupling factor (superfamily II helicase)